MSKLTILVVPFILAVSIVADTPFPAGVLATGTMGVTNPPKPTIGTPINQTSYSRLLSVNSIDDFCLFAPPTRNNISDSETEEVAWCTQQRNNARVIPDGTLTGVTFLQTGIYADFLIVPTNNMPQQDFYVQVLGYGNLVNLNIIDGDEGGELDPHGQFGSGNPVGGNVTVNIGGTDYNFAEWMLYIFCLRVCTNANSTYDAAHMCWHELDEMGCEFVMPGDYSFNGTFQTCDADVAYPPGWYPEVSGGTTTFSTFAQYFTGVANGQSYTVGDTITPSAPASTPSSSNCRPTSTISNGIALASLGLSGSVSQPTGTSISSSISSSGSSSSSSSSSSFTSNSTNAPGSVSGSGSKSSGSTTPTNTQPPSVAQKAYYNNGLVALILVFSVSVLFL